jgi:hypothetical protein
LTVKIILS